MEKITHSLQTRHVFELLSVCLSVWDTPVLSHAEETTLRDYFCLEKSTSHNEQLKMTSWTCISQLNSLLKENTVFACWASRGATQ